MKQVRLSIACLLALWLSTSNSASIEAYSVKATMTDQNPDDSANAHISEIVRLLIESEDLAGEWDAVALAVILDGTSYDSSGFRYRADGKAIPIAPEEDALYDQLIAYRDFEAQRSGKAPWKACLIQLDRKANSFDLKLEYDDPMRWKITPANLKDMREALRP